MTTVKGSAMYVDITITF